MTAGEAEIMQGPDQRQVGALTVEEIFQGKHEQCTGHRDDGNVDAIMLAAAREEDHKQNNVCGNGKIGGAKKSKNAIQRDKARRVIGGKKMEHAFIESGLVFTDDFVGDIGKGENGNKKKQ